MGKSGDGRLTRARERLAGVAGSSGRERGALAVVLKGTLAATLAWAASYYLIPSPAPAFAPFTALMMVQATVYQSVVQSLSYVLAVVLGIALQALLAVLAGPDIVTFALVSAAALVIGRWHMLRDQRKQVATAAFFAFSVYVGASGLEQRLLELGQIVLVVLAGCAIGVAVNLTVFPPLRLRGARYAVQTLAETLRRLCEEIGQGLCDGDLDESSTSDWMRRTREVESITRQARAAVAMARESTYFNPRRLLHPIRGPGYDGYDQIIDSLERVTHQVTSLTRSLVRWREDDRSDPYRSFLVRCGEFLGAAAEAMGVLEELSPEHLARQSEEFRSVVQRARRLEEALEETGGEQGAVPLGDPWRPYPVLLIEASRLMDELESLDDLLAHHRGTRPT